MFARNLNAECGEKIHAEKHRADIEMMTENKIAEVIVGFALKQINHDNITSAILLCEKLAESLRLKKT